eukprot:SAG22_NODE_1683_length_3817_cov_1.449704_3_plen_221_part_00
MADTPVAATEGGGAGTPFKLRAPIGRAPDFNLRTASGGGSGSPRNTAVVHLMPTPAAPMFSGLVGRTRSGTQRTSQLKYGSSAPGAAMDGPHKSLSGVQRRGAEPQPHRHLASRPKHSFAPQRSRAGALILAGPQRPAAISRIRRGPANEAAAVFSAECELRAGRLAARDGTKGAMGAGYGLDDEAGPQRPIPASRPMYREQWPSALAQPQAAAMGSKSF